MRLAAGFGSQISLSVMRWTPLPDRSRRAPDALGYAYRVVDRAAWSTWLQKVSGQASPDLEVERRTLRVKDRNAIAAPARPSVAPTAPLTAPVVNVRENIATPVPVQAPAKTPAPVPVSQQVTRDEQPLRVPTSGRPPFIRHKAWRAHRTTTVRASERRRRKFRRMRWTSSVRAVPSQ
jgi:hypothetical protein